jgi:hypothetical protein
MKFAVIAAVLILLALSFYADYRWKRWIAARKQEREHPSNPDSFPQ